MVCSQQARQSKEKPAIVLAALELSHRLMSGPPPLVGGSRGLLLKQRGLGLHVTVFEHKSVQRGRTKDNSCLSCQFLNVGKTWERKHLKAREKEEAD